MPRSRASLPSRLSREASRLVALSLALHSSGSRIEDCFWEVELAKLIGKLLATGKDQTINAALDHLSQHHLGGYEVLMEQAETLSESCVIEKDGIRYDVLLILAPLVAWTRYSIPTQPISSHILTGLVGQMQQHVLATKTKISFIPQVVSLDQMPRGFSETWQWLHRLGESALGNGAEQPVLNEVPDSFNMLADTRYLVGAIAVEKNQALFRWQEQPGELGEARATCLEQWAAGTKNYFADLIPGCGFEILVPDAFYVSNREADRRVRPLSVKAAIAWLCAALAIEPSELRVVIASCGEQRVEEYRIGFTQKHQNEVVYGCLWPMYGREDDALNNEPDAPARDTASEISELIKSCGVEDVRQLPTMLALDFCDDCGAPYFPNPAGEMVHAELPEDAQTAPTQFH